MVRAARGVVPVNTEISTTEWAVKNFTEWVNNQIVLVPGDNLTECQDAETVGKYLCMFILEIRKADGTKYSPGSIRSLLSGLNRVLKEKASFSVFDDQHIDFRELSKTLDVVSNSCSPKELC